MRKLYTTYGITFLLLFATGGYSLYGQISSSAADYVRELSYKNYPDTNQLFVFYQLNGNLKSGSLRASIPPAGNLDFTWTKYDPDNDAFSLPVKAETGVASSQITNLDEGAYRVSISGTGIDTFFIAWVMLDNFLVTLEKDSLGHVPYRDSQCPEEINWIVLKGNVELDKSFYYFDLQTHDTLRIVNDFKIEWTSDNPDLEIANQYNKNAVGNNYAEGSSSEDSPYIPYEDTWYILTAWDSLGMVEVDSVFYETKFTKAEFTVEYWDKVVAETSPSEAWDPELNTEWDKEKGSLDAPLKVRYLNESLNADEFTWVFVDSISDSGESNKEYYVTDDIDEMPEFTYYRADKFYYPYLVSVNKKSTCRDTFFLDEGIEVVAAQLQIPNVFTPNGDGTNDVFLFKHQSIKSFRITIADRFGKVVYREKSDNIYEWEGWRGTILNSDREAPEGQYFFVIEALGYDNQEFKDPNILEMRKLNKQSESGGTTSPNTGPNGESPAQENNLYTGWVYLFRHKGVI